MITALVSTLVMAGLPKMEPLDQALVMFPEAVFVSPADGLDGNDHALNPLVDETCSPFRVSTMRAMNGALSSLEALQAWFKKNPKVEATLFGKDGATAAIFDHVSKAQVTSPALEGCSPPELDQGRFTTKLSGKVCKHEKPAPSFQRWLTNNGVAAAAVTVGPSTGKACTPLISIALFDAKGALRVLLHADFGGSVSAELVGKKCQISMNSEASEGRFQPVWKNCKG